MNEKDIRWEQRFSNCRKASIKLTQTVKFTKENITEEDAEVAFSSFIEDWIVWKEWKI
ncbi:MAG: hypothetical protein LLF95_09590 [Bacteroidales bacterium]|nr:hypothetical protein [Bacteroidales bacterium]